MIPCSFSCISMPQRQHLLLHQVAPSLHIKTASRVREENPLSVGCLHSRGKGGEGGEGGEGGRTSLLMGTLTVFAREKSASLTLWFESMSRFSGLRSLCQLRHQCHAGHGQ